jgi:hypothetical protein
MTPCSDHVYRTHHSSIAELHRVVISVNRLRIMPVSITSEQQWPANWMF